MKKIKIAIAEDHELFRESLSALLQKYEDFDTIIIAEDGKDLLDKLQVTPVDLILMDIDMPNLDGIQATRKVKRLYSHTKVLGLSSHYDDDFISSGLKSGMNGYLIKDEVNSKEILRAKEEVMKKGFYFTERVQRLMMSEMKPIRKRGKKISYSTSFTHRELQVLQLICEGYSNEKISDKLFLAKDTIRAHRRSINAKTKISNLAFLVASAILNRWINIDKLEKKMKNERKDWD